MRIMVGYPWRGVGEGLQCGETCAVMGLPPNPPVVGLAMDEDDEHRRQIELLMGQIMSPIYNLQRILNVGGLV